MSQHVTRVTRTSHHITTTSHHHITTRHHHITTRHHHITPPHTHLPLREFFERVVEPHGGLDEFEAYQEEFAGSERLNDIYRQGKGPAGVHGFYMYTWAAHGMEKVKGGAAGEGGALGCVCVCVPPLCTRGTYTEPSTNES